MAGKDSEKYVHTVPLTFFRVATSFGRREAWQRLGALDLSLEASN